MIERTMIICDNFNKFFIESIVKINSQIPIVAHSPQMNDNSEYRNRFKFNMIDDCGDCKKKKNKSEILNFSVWYDSLGYVGYFLTKIINESSSSGAIPDIWKVATVHPVPKIIKSKKCSRISANQYNANR